MISGSAKVRHQEVRENFLRSGKSQGKQKWKKVATLYLVQCEYSLSGEKSWENNSIVLGNIKSFVVVMIFYPQSFPCNFYNGMSLANWYITICLR